MLAIAAAFSLNMRLFPAKAALDTGEGAYRFAGVTSAGNADGTSWENRWAYTSIPWATVESLATGDPVYIFLDGGSTARVYTSTMVVNGAGSSDTNRIHIMPGYAAQHMNVPGNHTDRIGQVIFDLGGADVYGIHIRGSVRYVTIDGYADPRPSGASNPKLILRNVNGDGAALICGEEHYGPRWITVRNVEVYQEDVAYLGDGIIFISYTPHTEGNIVVENCYIHDGGFAGVQYAAIWIKGLNSSIIRYCEIRDWARDSGEGVGFHSGRQTGGQVHGNLFVNVGIAVRAASRIRYNTFYNCYTPIHTTELGEDIYIENNGLYESRNEALDITGSDTVHINANVLYDTRLSCDAMIHQNCILTVADLNSIIDSGVHIQSNNLVGSSGYLVDPPADCRLHPIASNAIDRAYTANWSPVQDFLGSTRAGSAWDIGAHEYAGEVESTSTPTPTNTPTSAPINTLTPTATPTATSASTNTPTPVPPTATPTVTDAPTSTPTNTSIPTATNVPTSTPTNTPMPTPVDSPQSPQVGTVAPNSGSTPAGQTQYLSTSWSDPNGWEDLKWCFFLIGPNTAMADRVFAYYSVANHLLYLRNDGGNAWLGGYAPGSANTITNSQVTLDCSETEVLRSGNTIEVRWALTFDPSYPGTHNQYLKCKDKTGLVDGWHDRGTWTIDAAPTWTPAATPTQTLPATASATPTHTLTPTQTDTPTDTPVEAATPTPTRSPTGISATSTPEPTHTPTASPTTRPVGSETTVTLQQDANGYSGCKDTYIYQYTPDSKYYLRDQLKVGYKQRNATLVSFDLSSIPADASVTQAALGIYATGWSGSDITIGAYRILRNSDLAQATWNQAQTDNYWRQPGCNDTSFDRRLDPESSLTTSSIGKWYDFDLTSLVQEWVNGTQVNNGVLLRATYSPPSFYFASAQSASNLRPKLVISYTSGGEPFSITADDATATSSPIPIQTRTASPTPTRSPTGISVTSTPEPTHTPTASPTTRPVGSETTVTLQQDANGYSGCKDTYIYQYTPDSKYYLRDQLKVGYKQRNATLVSFDLSSIPADASVTQAALGIYATGWSGSDITIGAYRILRNSDLAQATWNQAQTDNYWRQPGCNDTSFDRRLDPESSLTTSSIGKWYDFDLTSLVQEWVNGTQANNGILLRATYSPPSFYFASAQSAADRRPRLVVSYR